MSEIREYIRCQRAQNLVELFKEHKTVKVRCSQATLEYDLAEAGENNADIIAEVWESCFDGTPTTFNKNRLANAGNNRQARALAAWRGICRANNTGSKAELAHRLADHFDAKKAGSWVCPVFEVPNYLKQAIEDAVQRADAKIADGRE